MTYYRLKTNPSENSFILQKSNYAYINPDPQPKPDQKPRQLSKLNSDSYNRSLRRAFARAKLLAFFNPDLTQFITLTYQINLQDPNKTIQDIKNLITYQTSLHPHKKETPSPDGSPDLNSPTRGMKPSDQIEPREPQHSSTTSPTITQILQNSSSATTARGEISRARRERKGFKYIYVMELQKRGAIHVHMICNDWLEYEYNNGHKNVKGWSWGFSDVKTIKDFDNNFRPYLYLFKYMTKAQRVGKSFIHASRNFDKITVLDYREYIDKLNRDYLLYTEDHEFTLNEKVHTITKEYYRQPTAGNIEKEITV